LATFPELNQAFDVGERLTLPLPVSFDPVKGVDLIFQLHGVSSVGDASSIKMRILLNASKRFGSSRTHGIKCSQLISAFKYLGEMCEINQTGAWVGSIMSRSSGENHAFCGDTRVPSA
jgi:hypothetical protein